MKAGGGRRYGAGAGRSGHSWPLALVTVALSVVPGLAAAQRPAEAIASGDDVPAGLAIDSRERLYELDAATLSEVIERLHTTRLQGRDAPLSQGLTEWRIRPRWRPSAAGGRCRVSDLRLEVSITVTLPTWTRLGSAPLDERERWSRIERAIREHEYEHRDLTISGAEVLLATLTGLETRGCAALRRRFDGEMSLAEGRIRRGHAELDRATPGRLIG